VKWDVSEWDIAGRAVILDKAVKMEILGRITHEWVVAHIGTEPLKLERNE
jgi:hypothetical protein